MKSYASIDRIEEDIVVCEVELIPTEQSKPEDYAIKETVMITIPLVEASYTIESVAEGDIWIVEHDGESISNIYSKDDVEKARRLEVIEKIIAMWWKKREGNFLLSFVNILICFYA